MRNILLIIPLFLFALRASALPDIISGEWVGGGTYSIDEESFDIKTNFNILTDQDNAMERFVSAGFVGEKIGIMVLDFWMHFNDANHFDIYPDTDTDKEDNKIGKGSCENVVSVGLRCSYDLKTDLVSVTESITFQEDGILTKKGVLERNGRVESWNTDLTPVERDKK